MTGDFGRKFSWRYSERQYGEWRLPPALPELVRVLERHGELTAPGEVRKHIRN